MIKEIKLHGELSSGTYIALQQSLAQAVGDPLIKAILLDIDSSGGTIEALHETANVVKEASKTKPVYAYTQTKMLSAAYWLGAQATKVFASEKARIGSIGVLAVHFDYSNKLEKDGIHITVLRSVENKAVPNIYEPLNEQAKMQLQETLNKLHLEFVNAILDARKDRVMADTQKWATGEVFDADKALNMGLIDEVISPTAIKTHIQHQLNAQTMDSNMFEKIADALSSIKDFITKEKKTIEKQTELNHELEAKVSELQIKMSELEKEKEALKSALHEEEVRRFIVASNKFYGEALEKAVELAKQLSDKEFELFKAFVDKLPNFQFEAKFTSGTEINTDKVKEQLEMLEKYIKG